jgi:hypothetical protein
MNSKLTLPSVDAPTFLLGLIGIVVLPGSIASSRERSEHEPLAAEMIEPRCGEFDPAMIPVITQPLGGL